MTGIRQKECSRASGFMRLARYGAVTLLAVGAASVFGCDKQTSTIGTLEKVWGRRGVSDGRGRNVKATPAAGAAGLGLAIAQRSAGPRFLRLDLAVARWGFGLESLDQPPGGGRNLAHGAVERFLVNL